MSFWSPTVPSPVTADFLPVTTGAYSIGSTTFRWLNGWFSGNLNLTNAAAIHPIAGTVDITTKLQVGSATGTAYKGFFYSNSAVAVVAARQDGAGNIAEFLEAAGNPVFFVSPGGAQIFGTNKLSFSSTADQTYVRAIASNTLGFGTNGVDRWQIESNGMLRVLSGSFSRGGPLTKTADWTVADNENWYISNRAATNTVTLPAAASYSGREIMIKTIQAQTVVSASSNVVPLAGGAAGTAILAATAGRWATLVSDGTNWVIMQGN